MATHHRSPDTATLTISLPPDLLQAVDRRMSDLFYLSRSSYVCSVLRSALAVPARPAAAPRGRRSRKRRL